MNIKNGARNNKKLISDDSSSDSSSDAENIDFEN